MKDNLNEIVYYCDGACSGNPGPGGFGVIRLSKCYSQTMTEYIERYDLQYAYQELHDKTTNNRMELMAMIHALSLVIKDPYYHYTIYSDSAYVVNICNNWIWGWAENNWTRAKGKPIENLDLIKDLYELLTYDIHVSIKKVAGHAGILENELVDAIAANNEKKFNKLIKKYNIIT